jgi:hypothetical membrane protein
METVAALLYGLDILMLLSFEILNRDRPAFSHAVSDYGVGKTARLFQYYVLAGCIAAPLLAWQVLSARNPGYPAAVSVYLVLVAVGRFGIGLFPKDPYGAARTRTGQIHRAATLLAFCCTFMAISEATPILAATEIGEMSRALTVLKHFVAAGFIAVIMTGSASLRPFFGLAERVFLFASAVWFLLASLTLPPL